MQNPTLTKLNLLFVSTLTIMSSATIAPVLPQMAHYFSHTPNAELLSKLILTVPALFIAISAPICGWISDRWGRRKPLLSALLLYGLAGTAGFVLNDLIAILISRAFLGAAIAGIMTTATALVGDYFADDERRRFVGLQAGFMAVGGVLFVGAGGLIADLNWRYPFLIHLFALMLLPSVYLSLPEASRSQSNSDVHPSHQRLPLMGLLLLIGFAFISMILFYMMPVQVPFLLKDIGIFQSAMAGLAIVCFSVTGTTVSFLYPKIKRHADFLSIYLITCTFMSLGYLLIGTSSNFLQIAIGMAIAGMGIGLIVPNQNLWVITLSPDHLRGRMIGIVSAAFFLGQFSSPLFIQPLMRVLGSLHRVFYASAGFLVVLALGLLWLRWSPWRQQLGVHRSGR